MRAFLAVLVVLAVGCLQPGDDSAGVAQSPGKSCASCRSTAGAASSGGRGAASGGAGSSGGSGSGSGGSTGGGASGGTGSSGASSSGGGASSGGGGLDAGCPEVYIETRFYDGLLETPISGAAVQALDASGVPISGSSAVSDANGEAVVCVPRNQQVTLTAMATGYPSMFMEDAILQSPWSFGLAPPDGGTNTGILMLSTQTLLAIAPIVTPPLDPNLPTIVVSVLAVTPGSPCLPFRANWQISLSESADGPPLDGGFLEVYMGNSEIPEMSATATTESGVALIYNIDSSISPLFVRATNLNPDAGVDCPFLNDTVGLTGQVDVNDGELSYAPVLMP